MQSLTFSGLSKAYGGAVALHDVTLILKAGRIHALMGENGAGKSTPIKLIAGVVRADRMEVLMDGPPSPCAHRLTPSGPDFGSSIRSCTSCRNCRWPRTCC